MEGQLKVSPGLYSHGLTFFFDECASSCDPCIQRIPATNYLRFPRAREVTYLNRIHGAH